MQAKNKKAKPGGQLLKVLFDAVSINEGVYTLHDLCELNFPRPIDQELKNVRGIVFKSGEINPLLLILS